MSSVGPGLRLAVAQDSSGPRSRRPDRVERRGVRLRVVPPRIGEARSMAVMVTGCTGFIGYHVSLARLGRGDEVIGVDNLNDYYDPALKLDRLAGLAERAGFTFAELDIASRTGVKALTRRHRSEITGVIHLAAQAGVRHS